MRIFEPRTRSVSPGVRTSSTYRNAVWAAAGLRPRSKSMGHLRARSQGVCSSSLLTFAWADRVNRAVLTARIFPALVRFLPARLVSSRCPSECVCAAASGSARRAGAASACASRSAKRAAPARGIGPALGTLDQPHLGPLQPGEHPLGLLGGGARGRARARVAPSRRWPAAWRAWSAEAWSAPTCRRRPADRAGSARSPSRRRGSGRARRPPRPARSTRSAAASGWPPAAARPSVPVPGRPPRSGRPRRAVSIRASRRSHQLRRDRRPPCRGTARPPAAGTPPG